MTRNCLNYFIAVGLMLPIDQSFGAVVSMTGSEHIFIQAVAENGPNDKDQVNDLTSNEFVSYGPTNFDSKGTDAAGDTNEAAASAHFTAQWDGNTAFSGLGSSSALATGSGLQGSALSQVDYTLNATVNSAYTYNLTLSGTGNIFYTLGQKAGEYVGSTVNGVPAVLTGTVGPGSILQLIALADTGVTWGGATLGSVSQSSSWGYDLTLAPVPLPSSLGLTLLGLAGMAGFARLSSKSRI
jgi:hypothetical protein